MRFDAITGAVADMSVDNLRALNRIVVARINHIQREKTAIAAREFQPGDMVNFTGKDGRLVTMAVERINSKSIGGTEVRAGHRPTKWRVHPTFCTLVVKPLIGTEKTPGTPFVVADAGTCNPLAPGAATW